MEKHKQPKLSRSIRLEESTLKELKRLADEKEVGITVYIRMILEAVVANSKNTDIQEV